MGNQERSEEKQLSLWGEYHWFDRPNMVAACESIAEQLRRGEVLTRLDFASAFTAQGLDETRARNAANYSLAVNQIERLTGLDMGRIRYRGHDLLFDRSLDPTATNLDTVKERIDELKRAQLVKRRVPGRPF